MDWEEGKRQLVALIKKYRYFVLVLLSGIIFMLIPEKTEAKPAPEVIHISEEENFQQQLSQILSRISGAGQVEVLLTRAQGSSTLYQTDSISGEREEKENTVIVANGNREEHGLVRQVNPPRYMGAVIVCQGGDNAMVRLAVVEAVKSATGLSSDRITVLKMG